MNHYPAMANYYTDLGDLSKVDWALLNRKDFQHDQTTQGRNSGTGGSADLEARSSLSPSWNLQLQRGC
jgi:hypothetical protein